MRSKLVLYEELSAFLIKKVKELESLQNASGRLVIPFVYRGNLPGAKVYPDLNYVASSLIQGRGEELLAKGIDKLTEFLEKKI